MLDFYGNWKVAQNGSSRVQSYILIFGRTGSLMLWSGQENWIHVKHCWRTNCVRYITRRNLQSAASSGLLDDTASLHASVHPPTVSLSLPVFWEAEQVQRCSRSDCYSPSVRLPRRLAITYWSSSSEAWYAARSLLSFPHVAVSEISCTAVTAICKALLGCRS